MRNAKMSAFVAFMVLAVLGILDPGSASAEPPPNFLNQTILTGLDEPIAIDFLPDGRLLIAERTGKILLASPPYVEVEEMPVITITNLEVNALVGGQGIIGLVVDPDFVDNGFFYLFYTAMAPLRHRITRLTLNPATGRALVLSERVIWQDNVTRNTWHFGGGMAFGPDGFFYFTTGDNLAPSFFPPHVSQDPTKTWGKLMRVKLLPEGNGPIRHPYYTVPLDNPYWDGLGPNYDEIYAMGLRNPFRIAFDSEGRLYVSDVGGDVAATAWEEVNVGAKGANYGWPLCEGRRCAAGVGGMTGPLYTYSHEYPAGSNEFIDASITGGFVYDGEQFPDSYRGAYFYADYSQHTVRYLTFDAEGNVTGDHDFEPADGTRGDRSIGDIVDLKMGPDGALYYVDISISWGDIASSGAGSVRRISYNAANRPPVVSAWADVKVGAPPLTVHFSGYADDPDNDPLTYRWEFGTGEISSTQNPAYTYATKGPYVARLTVSDGTYDVVAQPIAIAVGSPPQVSISEPISGTVFRAGDTIAYRGSATDSDGFLTRFNYTWRILFHHDNHVHPFLEPVCCTVAGTLDIESTGHSWEGDTWFEIILAVTDGDGLPTAESVAVYPEKVMLALETEPSGLEIRLDELTAAAPFARHSLIGFQHVVEAALQQELEGIPYHFVSWSDGGAATHSITTPEVDAAFVASYRAACIAEVLLPAGNFTSALDALYQVRDGVLAETTAGQHYRDMYYANSDAVVQLLLAEEPLRIQAEELLLAMLPGLSAMAVNQGDKVLVTQAMVEGLETFMAALSEQAAARGKAALAQVLEQEEARLDWQQLSGRSFAHAWDTVNKQFQEPVRRVYLPLTSR